MVQPLVSVLIPAFNPTFFEAALMSVRQQTHRALEIIVGDDCPTDEIEQVTRRHMSDDDRISYVRNDPPGGPRGCYSRLFPRASADYVKWCNDDDVLHPDQIRRFVSVLELESDVVLVASHRRVVDAVNTIHGDLAATLRPVLTDTVIPGRHLVELALGTKLNLIGEQTTTLIRRRALLGNRPDIMSFSGRAIEECVDLAMWSFLLMDGDAAYLTASLSDFRFHSAQRQMTSASQEAAMRSWPLLELGANEWGLDLSRRYIAGRKLTLKPWWSPSMSKAVGAARQELDRGMPSEAVQAVLPHLSADPDPVADDGFRFVVAEMLVANGQFAEANAIYRSLLKGASPEPAAVIGLANLANVVGQWATSSGLLARARQLCPFDARLEEFADGQPQASGVRHE